MQLVTFLANFMSILASSIVVYLFAFKRKSVSNLMSFVTNYAFQQSLSELKEKLEKLNDYNSKDSTERDVIIIILHEIAGQIRGNTKLKFHFAAQLDEINLLSSDRFRLTEPNKRALVSELRERLRHLNISNIDELVGDSP